MYERAQQQQAASEPSGNGSANGAGADEEQVVDAEVVDEGKS